MDIKVLHVIESISSGGVERRRLLMTKYLSTEFEQRVICTTTRGPLVQAMRDTGVQVVELGRFRSLFSISHYIKIIKIVRLYKPQIIHGAVFEGITMAAVVGFFCRVPIVILEETSDPKNRSWKGNLLLRFLSLTAKYVVAISPSVKEYLAANGIQKSKIKLIPNGVDVPREVSSLEREALRASLGLGPDDFVVGTVGRLRDFHKRVSDLIRAVAMVRQRMPLRLLIVGDGTDRQMLEDLARELGVSDIVIFAGYQYDTSAYYKVMDVFSLASHMEGFGLVVIEAMLSRVPVVVTNVGGLKDIVTDGVTGCLVEPYAPEQFAGMWQKLYEDRHLCSALIERAFLLALSNFTSEAYIKKVAAMYMEAVQTLNEHPLTK